MSDKEENSDGEQDKKPIGTSKVIEMKYCGVCGLPPEYCEFGPSFEKCKPWLIENCPNLYPNLSEESANVSADGEESKSTGKRGGKGLVKPEGDSEVKMLPGGKLKKKEKPVIHIARVQRNKRKYVTIIIGLEKFGVKLPEASKLLAKKFSCGASVVKSPNGDDEIDVQGDFTDEIIDYVMEKWSVPDDSIITEDGKHKGPNKKRAQAAAAATSASKD